LIACRSATSDKCDGLFGCNLERFGIFYLNSFHLSVSTQLFELIPSECIDPIFCFGSDLRMNLKTVCAFLLDAVIYWLLVRGN